MGEPIRVLHVFGNTNLGGAESRVMDMYRCVDRSRIQFDFVAHGPNRGHFDDEIESLGGKVYRLPRFRGYNYFAYKKAWKAFFKTHPGYCFVHGHMTSTASIYLPIAKRAGVPRTAAHARSSGVDHGPKGMLTRFLRIPLWKRTDYCLSTSALAGEAVFGKKAAAAGLVHVIPNAIMAEKYGYNPAARKALREELHLGDALVLGHVGRFDPQKNHPFLLEIFAQVCRLREDAVLLLVGEGGLMEQARQKAKELGVAQKVLFVGKKSNVADYYQAMDIFVFPSFYEGLPGTVLEAQAAGLPCLISDRITPEVKLTELVQYMGLEHTAGEWAEWIVANSPIPRRSRLEDLKKKGYDARGQAEMMTRFYETGELPW